MPKNVVWSSFAEDDFNGILNYLHQNWEIKVTAQFIDYTETLILKISNQPKLYPFINPKLKIRKCVMTKHNSLYYREEKEKVEILRIYDNRRNPKKVRFLKS